MNRDLTQPLMHGLESTITSVSGEDKKEFIRFVSRILKWLSEEHATAKELLSDPWLHS